jgi:hypothetical protein
MHLKMEFFSEIVEWYVRNGIHVYEAWCFSGRCSNFHPAQADSRQNNHMPVEDISGHSKWATPLL